MADIGIRAGILRKLMNQTAALGPWVRGDEYGKGPYNVVARLHDAGTNFETLHSAGFTLQSELYNDYKDDKRVDKHTFRDAYKTAHGGVQVDHRSNMTATPSGLRPRVVPATATAGDVAAWYQAVVIELSQKEDHELIAAPPVGTALARNVAESGQPKTATGAFGRPKVTGPEGWRVFQGAMASVKDGVAAAVNALRTSEDKVAATPFADALAAWALTTPDVSKVTSALFDTTIIRLDSEIELLPGVPETGSAALLARRAGIETPPKTFRVVAFHADGTGFDAQPFEGVQFKRALPVKIANAKRVVRVAPPAPVDPTKWKPVAGGTAFLMEEEVLVVSISADGKTATIDIGEDSTLDVDASSLTMAAPKAPNDAPTETAA